MSKKLTIIFCSGREFRGTDAYGNDGSFLPCLNKEYCVTMEKYSEYTVILTMTDGFSLKFNPPGQSFCYSVVREGWSSEAVFPVGPLVKPSAKPAWMPPILESTVILEIEPAKHNSLVTHTEYLIYKLPRVLNGLLVDRGRCDQETVADRANVEAIGELRGVASFMLTSRNNNLRYQCVSFRIDNITTKKNLTKQYFGGSVCTS